MLCRQVVAERLEWQAESSSSPAAGGGAGGRIHSGTGTPERHVDPDFLEQYFHFLLTDLQLCPAAVVQSACLSALPRLCLSGLQCAEFGPVRAALHVVQRLFSPIEESLEPHFAALFHVARPVAPTLLSRVLGVVLGSIPILTMLQSTYADTLYFVLEGCLADDESGCGTWLRQAVHENAVSGILPAEYRDLVVETLIRLTHSDRRRFKVFLQDLSKVCTSEQDIEVLLSYVVAA